MVQRCPLFQKLTPSTLSALAVRLGSAVALRNTNILTLGDVCHNLYFVKRGVVQLLKASGEPFARLSAGAHFGAMHVVLEERLLFTAVASTDCELLVLSREDLRAAALQSPEFFCTLQSLRRSTALRGTLRESLDDSVPVQEWSSGAGAKGGPKQRFSKGSQHHAAALVRVEGRCACAMAAVYRQTECYSQVRLDPAYCPARPATRPTSAKPLLPLLKPLQSSTWPHTWKPTWPR